MRISKVHKRELDRYRDTKMSAAIEQLFSDFSQVAFVEDHELLGFHSQWTRQGGITHPLIEDDPTSSARFWQPLDIHAELFARTVIRQIHPGENLDPLLGFYKEYEPILQFESSGGFDVYEHFREFIRQGPSGLRDWILTTPNRECRGNAILLRLAPE